MSQQLCRAFTSDAPRECVESSKCDVLGQVLAASNSNDFTGDVGGFLGSQENLRWRAFGRLASPLLRGLLAKRWDIFLHLATTRL